MERAYVTAVTPEIEPLLDWANEDPQERRALTSVEQRLLDTVLDWEDGSMIVTTDACGGTPVWYLDDTTDDTLRIPSDLDNEKREWPAGRTYPRTDDTRPTEPQEAAIAQCGEDYAPRHEDVDDAEDAADLAVIDVLNHPGGWPGLVPGHWQPAEWIDCYRTAYMTEWMTRAAEA